MGSAWCVVGRNCRWPVCLALAVLWWGGLTPLVAAELCASGRSRGTADDLSDLQTAIGVIAGRGDIASCPGLDENGDRTLSVDELVAGVAASLGQPGAAPAGGGAAGLGTAIMHVGSASGVPGQDVSFGVTLDTGGLTILGVVIEISFDPYTPVASNLSLDPDCSFGPGVLNPFGGFAFISPNTVRAVVVSFSLDPILDGGLLFTCNVGIDLTAPIGVYPLPCGNTEASDEVPNLVPSSCTPGAITVVSPSSLVDHYKCYQGTDLDNPPFAKQVVNTSDQIGGGPVDVQKVKYVCAPVDKNGEGIMDPSTHLTCYQVKAAVLEPPPRALVITQFQQTNFELKKPKLLCVPSTKTVLP